MKNSRSFRLMLVLLTGLVLGIPAAAQEQQDQKATAATTQTSKQANSNAGSTAGRFTAGQKQKLSGVIVQREGDNLVVRDYKGTEYNVSVSNSTKIKERKSNPFRGA